LALPAEIRLSILEYVLGGFAIEIAPYYGQVKCPSQVRSCSGSEICPNASLSSPVALRKCDDSLWEDANRLFDPNRHYRCQPSRATNPTRSLNLRILLVCRRIYREAALLPFQKNTFTLHMAKPYVRPHPTFRTFLDTLAPEQREALAHITVASIACFLKENKYQLPRLKGLRSLHIVQKPEAGFTPIHNALSSSWAHAGGLLTAPGGSSRNTLVLRHLQSVRLTQEARFSGSKLHAKFEESVVVSQTPALVALLRLVEARLFKSLTGRPMPVAADAGGEDGGEGEEGRENDEAFEECAVLLRFWGINR
jgi:hypothetical protein